MNKIITALVSGLLVLGCVASSACSRPDSSLTPPSGGWPYAFQNMLQLSGYGMPSMDIILETELPDSLSKIAAYKIIYPKVDEEYATNIARRLGFTDDPVFFEITSAPMRSWYSYEKENLLLEIALNGSILMFNSNFWERPEYLPSDEECIAIATQWLKDHDLYPDNVVGVTTSSDRRVEFWDTEKNIMVDYYQVGTEVHFSVAVDGITTIGGGALVVVGDNGTILRMDTNKLTIEKAFDVPLKDASAAFAILKDKLTSSEPPTSMDNLECLINHSQLSRLVINSVELHYFYSVASDYLLPIYRFTGVGYDERQNMVYEYDFIGQVDAVLH